MTFFGPGARFRPAVHSPRNFSRRGIRSIVLGVLGSQLIGTLGVVSQTFMEYVGTYTCVQGLVALRLRVLDRGPGVQRVIFSFGPLPENPDIPGGEFLMTGHVDPATGLLSLVPSRWLERPPGYAMIGLSGNSVDHGNTFAGTVTGARGCGTFHLSRDR